MQLMAKRKKTHASRPTDEGKPPVPRSGKPLNVRLEDALRDALDVLAERTRRTLTEEVSIALEEHLAKHGLWPPPAEGAGSTST